MVRTRTRVRGVSLIETLVVLIILGVLTLALIPKMGSSYTNAVVSVTNQIEGFLYAAQRSTTTTLNTVTITASGTWEAKTFRLTYGSAAPADDLRYSNKQPDFLKAGVDPTTTGWPSSLGSAPSFGASSSFTASMVAGMAKPLVGLNGGTVNITGTRKEFSSPFFIAVVPYDSSGKPLYSGPAGLVVVEGSRIYKYVRSSKTGPWRRS